MVAFLKSDVFVKFLGGFVLGTIGILTLQPSQTPAEAAPAQSPPAVVDATL